MLVGYIKLHRKFKEWEWYKNVPTKTLFIELLLKCNYAPSTYNGQPLLAGQLVCSYRELANASGLSVQQVRTALKKLISTQEITRASIHRKSLITVVNWGKYQAFFEAGNTVNNVEDGGKSTHIYKNIKNNKNINPLLSPLKKGGRKKRNDFGAYDLELYEKMLNEKE